VVATLTSKLKIGYIALSTLAIILASHLLLSDSNLPYFVALLFLGLAVLVTVAVWYGIVRPLSKDMD
jgi:predicted membrane channel-forming protein YqfA (hemolysin III family)